MVKATWRPRKERGDFEVMVRDGRRRLFTRSFKTKGDAQQAAREINRVSMQGVEIKPPEKRAIGDLPPLREGLPAFITLMEQQREWQGSTPSRYLRRLQQDFFDFKLVDGRLAGDLRPFELTEQALGKILDSTRTGPTARSMAVREQIRCPLRRYYFWLKKKQGYRGPNPTTDLREYMGKSETKRQRRSKPYPFFARLDGALVLDTARKHHRRHLAKVAVMLLAGLRYGEAAALQKTDILWDKRTIYLQRAWSDETASVDELKNHVCRHAPLTKLLARLLREHLEDYPSESVLVFPGPVGNIQRHTSFLEHVWQPLMEKTGLPYREMKALRHSFATWALEGDVARGIHPEPITRVRDWMGHSSVEETERYAHVNSMGSTDSLDALGDDLG